MINLSPRTLNVLVHYVNEAPVYRSGPMLVQLFNSVGFHDTYGAGFPSRSTYTQTHLEQINGRSELEKIIRTVFSPREFGTSEKFTAGITAFNNELQFDGWNIFWDNNLSDISFKRAKPSFSIDNAKANENVVETEDDFLKKEFAEISFNGLLPIPGVQNIVEERLDELKRCLNVNAPLSAIFLTGSILEAVLLSIATSNASMFCKARAAQKDSHGNVKQITDWRLESLINVAKELGYLKEDVHKFCHVVRDFRNYIHPFEQNARQFSPDINTAKICLQVLKGAIAQINAKLKGGGK